MELVGISIILVVFVIAFVYIFSRTEGTDKKYYGEMKKTVEKEEITKKEEEQALNKLGEKMFDARDKLKRARFHIDEEEISPIQIIGKNQYVKMVCIDALSQKMAVISIVQSLKDPAIVMYDITNVEKCELEVNDKELYSATNKEVGYELKSIKLKITRSDITNPEDSIELLPKIVNNPNMLFRRDYFDFARDIQKHILKINKVAK